MFRGLLKYVVTNNGLLPKEYQQVEYIESTTGDEFIDTGVVPNNNTGYMIKHTICEDNGGDNILIGCREDDDQTRFWIDIDWGWSDSIGWGFGSYSPKEGGYRHYISFSDEGRIAIISCNYYNNRKCFVDSYEYPLPQSTLPYISYSIYLFAGNNYGTTLYNSLCKIYLVEITDDNSLIRKMIPCYRKSDDEVGLYDIINGVFYTDSGGGNLIAGPVV